MDRSRTRPIQRALVDHLTIIHAPLPSLQGLAARHGSDIEVLHAVHVVEGKGKSLPILGTDQLVDIKRMNRLIAGLIATTVAQGFPASGETGEKQLGHDSSSSVLGHKPVSPALVRSEPRWSAET